GPPATVGFRQSGGRGTPHPSARRVRGRVPSVRRVSVSWAVAAPWTSGRPDCRRFARPSALPGGRPTPSPARPADPSARTPHVYALDEPRVQHHRDHASEGGRLLPVPRPEAAPPVDDRPRRG